MPLVIPKKDDDLVMLLKEGEGVFEVVSATPRRSSKGDDMIELLLKCWDSQNKEQNIFDYLTFNDSVFNQRKIKHFCYCVGLAEKYESGTFNLTEKECENKSGDILIGIQIDKTRKYAPKNCINDYLKINPDKVKHSPKTNKELDDDIPF